ncbi:hypothetical protein L6452_19613 [Arctium lappa]|uniref:Uncharacterized protein n=1 Tax=Arctium lappa TaxID=4217 RepID=A0ACB9B928_ARCLA|nr:hypothetical protein L6452_19613 [Arctium lappa]
MSKTPSSSASELPVKRKRGRPRKDESMPRNDKRQTQTSSISPAQPPPISAVTNLQPLPTVAMNPIADNHNMVGQVVTGVIDGVFDAGYLLSVRVGPNNTLLRGLVFQQGHFCPITPANDVAPHLKMCRRQVFQLPNSNQNQLCTPAPQPQPQPQPGCTKLTMPMTTMQHYQTTPMVAGGSSNSAPNLRMVEQDELMQVFEVSKMVEEPPKNDDCGHGLKNDHLVSDSDLMAESVPRNDVVKHSSLHCGASLVQDIDHESVIDEADRQKQQEGENPEPITRVRETGVEEQPSFGKDMLPQESEKQQGEVSKIDVNQDPNQAVLGAVRGDVQAGMDHNTWNGRLCLGGMGSITVPPLTLSHRAWVT